MQSLKVNEILSGEWWDVGVDEALISLEDGFAADIGAQVGDELTLRNCGGRGLGSLLRAYARSIGSPCSRTFS